jgi:hypothetical protein
VLPHAPNGLFKVGTFKCEAQASQVDDDDVVSNSFVVEL